MISLVSRLERFVCQRSSCNLQMKPSCLYSQRYGNGFVCMGENLFEWEESSCSCSNVLPPRFAQSHSSFLHGFPEGLDSIRPVHPWYAPVHHPGDARLLASLCQHLAHSLAGRHTMCGAQFLFERPLLGGTGDDRARCAPRPGRDHLRRHMVLAPREHQSVVELSVRPGRGPSSVLHGQRHLLQVPGVPVGERPAHRHFLFLFHSFLFLSEGSGPGGCAQPASW